MSNTSLPALLALADGTLWPGRAFGAPGERTGELVFNTGMTGYQEVLTDPSYHGQIPVMTQPHIGNYGTNDEDDESDRCWVAGFVVRAASPIASNWRATRPLDEYLKARGVIALTDVDTRALVRHVRIHGAMNAALSTVNLDGERLIALARAAADMNGLDLVREVTCAAPYEVPPRPDPHATHRELHVVAYDFGIKRNILRELARRNCRVTVVPAHTSAADALALHPDGIFLSNGPGDPAAVTYAIETTKALLGRVPIFGICLGHQILALALGGATYKLKFGHRGSNQPVQHHATRSIAISSHNHGFAVRRESLPPSVIVTHVNLNDGCVEGLAVPELRAFSVQYHPEAAPGPHDSLDLFDEFIALMLR
ncbi:MAG: glutamine-hydrolyzing carbamoyl-phosphate synthase small subunit [Anaerolineae bacterium]